MTVATAVTVGAIEDRDRSAATEYLTSVEFVPDMFHVYSQAGTEYTIDLRTASCTCPDAEYRNVRCKHIRRVEMEVGKRPIPVGVDVNVDSNLLRALEDGN